MKKASTKKSASKPKKSGKLANLIVTFDPNHLESAKKEIMHLLEEVKQKAQLLTADEGLAHIAVKDARKAVEDLEAISKKSLDKFEHTMKWIPIDVWCKNSVKEMQNNIKKMVKGIKPEEKWKMELKTRKLKDKPDEIKLIMGLTEVVDRKKVDLDDPEKIIKVEIIGNKAGLALLNKNHLLNIAKMKKK
jgi:tRNA(Ser,Leu) C12 N-acetylase TAN1